MNQLFFSILKCPVCGEGMQADGECRSVRCLGARTHCYDVARSGYINFTSPADGVGDGKEAVRARSQFLDGGYYERLSDTVNGVLDELCAVTVLDAGCGEGYYTNRMASGRTVIGVDLSRDGIDSAATRAKRDGTNASFFVGSLFKLPVQEGRIDAVTNLFAPCAEAEFSRTLREGGHLVLVGAGERHLLGLKERIYDNAYLNTGRADIPVQMKLIDERRLSYEIEVKGQEMIQALFSMTPYYWRTSESDRSRLLGLDALTTVVDFKIYVFEKGQ